MTPASAIAEPISWISLDFLGVSISCENPAKCCSKLPCSNLESYFRTKIVRNATLNGRCPCKIEHGESVARHSMPWFQAATTSVKAKIDPQKQKIPQNPPICSILPNRTPDDLERDFSRASIFAGVFRMLRTTIVKKEAAWAWVLITTLLVAQPCSGQEDSIQESTAKPQTGVFERLFGNSTSQANPPQKPKLKVPAATAATPIGKPTRSGFLVPLKSFTKAFRGPNESDDSEIREESNSQRLSQPRVQREPFKNLPRAQERRERETVDLRVERIAPELPPNSGRKEASARTPATIITADKSVISADKSVYTSPATLQSNSKSSNSKSVTAGTSKGNASEIVIESNSTSRRTAMEFDPADALISPRPADLTRDKQTAASSLLSNSFAENSQSKSRPDPKNLVDLGHPSEKPPVSLIKSSTREKPAAPSLQKQAIASESTTPADDIPRIARSVSNSATKQEMKDRTAQANIASKAATSIPTPSIHREMTVPGVRVTVNGPSSILVDEDNNYEVIATNEGTEPLSGLIVSIAVPKQVAVGTVSVSDGAAHPDSDENGNTVIWELGEIPPGSSRTAMILLKTPKAEHFALGVEWTTLPQNAELKIEVQQPQLAIALEGPSEVTFGKPQMYRIRVRNSGNADVKAISVAMTAEPYGSNQSDIGDVAAGSERIVEVELTFQQSGSLPIVATATSTLSKVQAKIAIDVQVRHSELVATWFGPAEFYQGSIVDYELELTNVGSITALGTQCSIELPPGAEAVALPTGSTRSGDRILWEIKKLDPQEKQTIPLRLTLSKIGDNQIVFTGACSSSAEAKADFITNIDAIADLHLTVVDPAAPAPVGQPVVYEIVITNRGKKMASDVEVIAQFSDGIEPVRVEGHGGRIVPGQAIFNSIPSIGPNDKLVLRIHAEASKPGVHRFRVEVKCNGSDTDLLEEESTRYLATGIKGDRR